jgi:glycosyltransferase involved in cell wall biosynthesis
MRSARAGLRVCLYYPWLYLTSGGERTIVEIAKRSRHRITIVTNEYQPDATFPELATLDVRVLDRVPTKRSVGAVGLAMWRIVRQRIDVSGYDAMLIVCEGVGDLVALRHPETPAFCLCLTPLRIAFDPYYRATYFRSNPPLKRLVVRAGAAAFAMVDRLAWRRYRRVFPISHEIERRIEGGRLAKRAKMQILHPGVDLDAFTPAPAKQKVFFLPGRIMWTKNIELAIDAFVRFQALSRDDDGWRLVIAGIVDRKSEPYLTKLRELAGNNPHIEFCVHPDDDTLRMMYRDCFATLFTAFNEDWGLVIIEAMASGKPVLAVDRGGPREIVRHETDGLLVEPDPEAFAAAMMRLVAVPDLYTRLAQAAPTGAARFGWAPFVQALDDAIEDEIRPGAAGAVQELAG